MTHINRMVPPNTDMAAAFESGDDADEELIRNLALFLTNFLSTHLRVVETPETTELLLNANFYLVKISVVDDREIFKICLEYWSKVSLCRCTLTDGLARVRTLRRAAISSHG